MSNSPPSISWTLAVDLERVRVGDRVLDRDLGWHDVFYIRMSACGRYKIAYGEHEDLWGAQDGREVWQ